MNSRVMSFSMLHKTISNVFKSNLFFYNYQQNIRGFHSSSSLFNTQKKINTLKQFVINEGVPKQTSIILPGTSVKHKSFRQRMIYELKHYYTGSKLLCSETKITYRLVHKTLNGQKLTRRERKQFIRTIGDLFRIVPFSVFIIVPFLEFTLPIFLKIFPNMLPSTFKYLDKEEEYMKKQAKIKLEVAKFLQDTFEEMAVKSNEKSLYDGVTMPLNDFIRNIRSTGIQPSFEDMVKFSSLWENSQTLVNLNREQLIALCKLLDISFTGPNHYLRSKLRLKFHRLKLDDKLILNEGIDNLNIKELQIACHERGMNSFDVSTEHLQSQLQQWLDLHVNKQIPTTILLLSNRFYLSQPELSDARVEIIKQGLCDDEVVIPQTELLIDVNKKKNFDLAHEQSLKVALREYQKDITKCQIFCAIEQVNRRQQLHK